MRVLMLALWDIIDSFLGLVFAATVIGLIGMALAFIIPFLLICAVGGSIGFFGGLTIHSIFR